MRKFSEIKGQEAIDVLAEILEPIINIVNDEEVRQGMETNVARSASIALKKHKKEVWHILAVIDGVEDDKLEIDLLTLPTALIELLSEPVVQELFQ